MKIKIKISVSTVAELENAVKEIRKIEKEHNCHCTLLEVEIN
ncbi:hypothetical protein [Vallitalea guaymasensis]|nr:hypothetical protein [Vallitalea guaymasensis]